MRHVAARPRPDKGYPAGRQLRWLLVVAGISGCASESPWTSGDDRTVAIAQAWANGDCARVAELAPGYAAASVLRLRTVSRWYGECLVTLGDLSGGISVLEPLTAQPYDTSSPDGAYALGRARFSQALASTAKRWTRPGWAQAEAAFDLTLDLAPHGAKATAARYYRGRARSEQRRYAASVEDLAVVAETLGVYQDNGRYYLGRAYYRQASETAPAPWEKAVATFDALLQAFPTSPYADNAAYFRARALERLGRAADAQDAYVDLLARYAASSYADDAGYHLTLLRLAAGDCAGASAALDGIPTDSPKRAAAAASLSLSCAQ